MTGKGLRSALPPASFRPHPCPTKGAPPINNSTQLRGHPKPKTRVSSRTGCCRVPQNSMCFPDVLALALSLPRATKEKALIGCRNGDPRGWGRLIGRFFFFFARTTPISSAPAIGSGSEASWVVWACSPELFLEQWGWLQLGGIPR